MHITRDDNYYSVLTLGVVPNSNLPLHPAYKGCIACAIKTVETTKNLAYTHRLYCEKCIKQGSPHGNLN